MSNGIEKLPRLYSEFAEWFPLLSPVEEYADEPPFFMRVLEERGLRALDRGDGLSLLELGSGAGSNAFYLKRHFARLTLCDISEEMHALSRRTNPECEHLIGDMRTMRLGREFDVVFIHDAIDYMTTRDDLQAALFTAAAHCRAGGLGLFVPDHTRESYAPAVDHGGVGGDGRAMRYFSWSREADAGASEYVTDYVYLFREAGKPLRIEYDAHTLGLFSRAEWTEMLQTAGFAAEIVSDPYGRDVFVGRKHL